MIRTEAGVSDVRKLPGASIANEFPADISVWPRFDLELVFTKGCSLTLPAENAKLASDKGSNYPLGGYEPSSAID